MARRLTMPVGVWLALTLLPALAIGATLWVVSDLVPACVITEQSRTTAPDGRFDLVTFSRDCGDTPDNSQATLVPTGDPVPFDAASFASVVAVSELAAGWVADGTIELTLPAGAQVLRQDNAVAGVSITYR